MPRTEGGLFAGGSVRRGGDRVRVTAQLIQLSEQTHLWAETLERRSRMSFEHQEKSQRRLRYSFMQLLLLNQRLGDSFVSIWRATTIPPGPAMSSGRILGRA